jgi:hypothetical protein
MNDRLRWLASLAMTRIAPLALVGLVLIVLGGCSSASSGSRATTTSGATTTAPTTTTSPGTSISQTTTPRPTTTTVVPTTTTTVPPGIRGYQEVEHTVSASCTAPGGSGTFVPCPGTTAPGPTATSTAVCPSGKKAIGGGGSTSTTRSVPSSATGPDTSQLVASYPTADGTGWTATGISIFGGFTGTEVTLTLVVTAYAICADVAPSST